MAHNVGACGKEWGSPTEVEEGENSNIQQPQSHHNVVKCGNAILTSCHVPCVPSWEEERKHSSQGSLTQHTSLGMWKRVGLTD